MVQHFALNLQYSLLIDYFVNILLIFIYLLLIYYLYTNDQLYFKTRHIFEVNKLLVDNLFLIWCLANFVLQVMVVGVPNVGKSSLVNSLRLNNLGNNQKAVQEGELLRRK